MSNAGRGDALPHDNEPTVDAITWAYVEAAGGDARGVAVRRCRCALGARGDGQANPAGAAHGLAGVHQGGRQRGPEGRAVRHRRYFGPNDADALLDAIGACRRACIAASSAAPIGGPIYRAANRLMEEIDLVAEVLTGNRRHFWLKPHSTPGSCPKSFITR
jgi:hypothetical protein